MPSVFSNFDPFSVLGAGVTGIGGLLFGRNKPAAEQFAANIGPMDTVTPFGSATTQGGLFRSQLSEPTAGMFNRFNTAALNELALATQFDPRARRADLLSQFRSLAAPEEDRAITGLESRLFGQGRLGSTGGALEQRALYEALARADLERAIAADEISFNQRLGLFNNASALSDQAIDIGRTVEAAVRASLDAGQFDLAGQSAILSASQDDTDALNNFFQNLGEGIAGLGDLSDLISSASSLASGGGPLSGLFSNISEILSGSSTAFDLFPALSDLGPSAFSNILGGLFGGTDIFGPAGALAAFDLSPAALGAVGTELSSLFSGSAPAFFGGPGSTVVGPGGFGSSLSNLFGGGGTGLVGGGGGVGPFAGAGNATGGGLFGGGNPFSGISSLFSGAGAVGTGLLLGGGLLASGLIPGIGGIPKALGGHEKRAVTDTGFNFVLGPTGISGNVGGGGINPGQNQFIISNQANLKPSQTEADIQLLRQKADSINAQLSALGYPTLDQIPVGTPIASLPVEVQQIIADEFGIFKNNLQQALLEQGDIGQLLANNALGGLFAPVTLSPTLNIDQAAQEKLATRRDLKEQRRTGDFGTIGFGQGLLRGLNPGR